MKGHVYNSVACIQVTGKHCLCFDFGIVASFCTEGQGRCHGFEGGDMARHDMTHTHE